MDDLDRDPLAARHVQRLVHGRERALAELDAHVVVFVKLALDDARDEVAEDKTVVKEPVMFLGCRRNPERDLIAVLENARFMFADFFAVDLC
jgi:hypothetical protein